MSKSAAMNIMVSALALTHMQKHEQQFQPKYERRISVAEAQERDKRRARRKMQRQNKKKHRRK